MNRWLKIINQGYLYEMAACLRLYRRYIIRNFGGTKNCLMFFLALLVTVFLIDRLIFAKQWQFHISGKSRSKLSDVSPSVAGPEQPAAPVMDNPKVADGQNAKEVEAEKPDEPKPQKPAEPMSRKCGPTVACPDGKYTYYVRSGVGRDGQPIVCFNGKQIVSPEKKNAGRGFNVVIVNDKTLEVEDVRTFDVYVNDAVMLRYLKLGVQEGHLVLMATLDEASYNMQDETRLYLKHFGSSLIEKVKFRDNFVMIGQKGLAAGGAIEKHLTRDQGQDFGEPVDISGCLSVPMGALEKVPLGSKDQKGSNEENVEVGEAKVNCGVTMDCGSSAFSVHLYTGRENKDMAKMCINGKYVFGQGLNDAGRGLNIAVVNPSTKDIYRIGHFDTFEADTSNLEIFLEMINDNDIVLIVSHDEASTNINLNIQNELQTLGSRLINKLSFRDAWAFVGQKGIVGKSPIEEIEFAGGGWPKPINKMLCIPTVLKGNPSNVSSVNTKRQIFCRKNRDNGGFCTGENVDLQIRPAALNDKNLENHEIFGVPVVVIPGPSVCQYNDLRLQLEALMLIPGLNPKMVTIFHTEATPECGEIADVFNFKTVKMNISTTSYEAFMQAVLERAWTMFSSADHLVVLEEDVVPSPDLLSFFAQCLPVLQSDDSLVGITAWNENGYDGVSSRPDLVYRTATFPGLGFLLKRKFYDAFMRGKMAECCSARSWDGWLSGKLGEKEMLVPDVSRVFRKEIKKSDVTEELFSRRRITSLETSARLSDVGLLERSKYEEELHRLIQTSIPLDSTDSAKCLSGTGLGFTIPESIESKVYSIYYEDADAKKQTTLSLLCKCFQLFYVKDKMVRGTHRGLVRFSYRRNIVFLVGSSTEYYKHKPSDLKPVPASNELKSK